MTPNEGAEASTSAKPPLRISSSAAICCIVRITDEGRVEVLTFASTTTFVSKDGRPTRWPKTVLKLPTESGLSTREIGQVEDAGSIVGRCFSTEILDSSCTAEPSALVRSLGPTTRSLNESVGLVPIISYSVPADRVLGENPSLHVKEVYSFLALPELDQHLRKAELVDAVEGRDRREKLGPPIWREAKELLETMQSSHTVPVMHGVAILQTLGLLVRVAPNSIAVRRYEEILNSESYAKLSGEPAEVVAYIAKRRLKVIPQPAPPRR